jgi:Carboxypeptidase regulatory-like domain
MTKQNFDVNKLRVASPCSVGWETMTGDERIRHCHSCQLNIYNISEMRKNEVENLIANREGRLCIRLYKRSDGTVLTKDCPVGFRAYQKRVSRFAGATLATILGLFSISFGQKKDEKPVDASKVKIVKTENQDQESVLYGIIADPNGTILPGAQIKLFKKGKKKARKTKSDSDGNYKFGALSEGTYEVEIKYADFQKLKIKNLKIKKNEQNQLDIVFKLEGESVTVGILY